MKQLLWIILILVFTTEVYSQDWPDWRGKNRDAIWNSEGIVEEFSSEVITPKWSVPIGSGYSGPTVALGKVYVTDRIEAPKPLERVLCFNEQTGKEIWRYEYECDYVGVGYPAGPRASVVINDGKAYSLGTMGHFFCFDAENGKVLWQRDLNSEYNIVMPIWGIAATPLIDGEKIIVHVSGENACVVAFNKNTGKEIWRNLD
ncbi:MAG: PQQ-binding-like beta-propeller repeat protein, partial [Draconibacterium sp.]|nr:PQQ-binding-like beta-propeller repeat protein [Draconibacterium sp.]